ncbi:mutS protein homolog 4 [Aphomia sociella]
MDRRPDKDRRDSLDAGCFEPATENISIALPSITVCDANLQTGGHPQRIINSSSTKLESSSSGRPRARVLASESADDCLSTPRNRPTALRYISSSSRGGHSGTRSARSTSTSAIEASVILAISEGRGMARGEIGIAAVDLKHPHLVLCQFSDTLLYTHTLTKINYFNPIEIIVPHTFCDGAQPNQLYQLIKEHYPLVNLTTVQRRHFNDAAGRQHIQTLCAPEYSAVYLQVLHKFYALTAAAAVLKYVEYIQCLVFARESLKIEYHSSVNTMIIDVGTASQLELVQPLVMSAGPTCCLLGVLGPTYTVGGIRALRACILQPSCNKEFIENRLDAVQDLIENQSGLMSGLQNVIKKLTEIDKILFLCVESPNQNMDKFGEAQLNQMLLLKTTMDIVPNLIEALDTANSGRLRKIKMECENPNYNEIASRIRNIIQEDAHLEKGSMGSLQRCFAVKPEINGLLDVARRMYSELIEDIQKMVEQLKETYDLPLKLNQNMLKGFHIVMPIAPKNRRNFSVEDLPPIFIQVHSNGASVTMTTEELVVMDQQTKDSLNEIQRMSNIVISGLLKELRPFMSSLYKLCENVAELDILLALAQASSAGAYIRPEFDTYMDIRNSVHPLLDYNSQVMPVPNDIYASPEQNFTIITGPNMGGKSIYIKQIAIMQVMAQIGCFLPATNAVLRLSDRIFSRIGFNDSVELNASTYVFEMKETQHILKGLTSSSLVIIDELCRSTCIEEGTSIAWAICEELLKSDAFTFFTTHFIYLTRLQDLYFNVVNRHTTVRKEVISNEETTQNRLVYQHKVEPGVTDVEYYGLALAANTNLPAATVKLAGELSELISETKKRQEITTPQISDEEILYKLNVDLRIKSRRNENSDDRITQILHKFKEDNPQLIERLKKQHRTDSSANYSMYNSRQFNTSSSDIVSDNVEKNKNANPECSGIIAANTSMACVLNNLTSNGIMNYASVKSSDELLNTMVNVDENLSNHQFSLLNTKENSPTKNTQTEELLNSNQIVNKNDNNCLYINSNIHNDSYNEVNDVIMIEEDANEDENVDDRIQLTVSDNSDIAEALTQVLSECSVDDRPKDNSDSMSVDDELLKETIEEINAELFNRINIESIVLTPPEEFRD